MHRGEWLAQLKLGNKVYVCLPERHHKSEKRSSRVSKATACYLWVESGEKFSRDSGRQCVPAERKTWDSPAWLESPDELDRRDMVHRLNYQTAFVRCTTEQLRRIVAILDEPK